MNTPILVPQLGNEIHEAEITEWLKAEGDTVAEGELLVVITTTKMSIELEASTSGVLSKIEVPEGELAEVGTTLGVITAE